MASNPATDRTDVIESKRAVGLYTFLKEFTQLRTRAVRDADRYEQVIWVADIPQTQGDDCIAWRRDAADASSTAWLQLRKPPPPQPPEAPKVAPFRIDEKKLRDSSGERPKLRAPSLGAPNHDSPSLEDHPDVRVAWDTYVEDQWKAWAKRDHDRRRIYAELFSMFQQQEGLGETYESIFGLGLLSWDAPNSGPVKRHLIATRISISVDTEHGTLTVMPVGTSAQPTLEEDMLDPQDRPNSALATDLKAMGDSLWTAGPLGRLLKSWVNLADAAGEYRDSLDYPNSPPGPTPTIHLAPALILRRRTERPFIHACESIVQQIKSGTGVPEGVRCFIEDSDTAPHAIPDGDHHTGVPFVETYFPLPANEEQRKIVEHLRTSRGVVVQGPPGTGKSHTIVNLISHALATNQRMLVTSHTTRALRVLHEMIRKHVPDISALVVVLLDEDLKVMEESVQEITYRRDSWNPQKSQADIKILEDKLDRERQKKTTTLKELQEIRQQETEKYDSKFGYSGTLAQIAEKLAGTRATLAWVTDTLPEAAEPPLTRDEFSELVQLLENGRIHEWAANGWVSIDVTSLPLAEEFKQLVRDEHETRAACERETTIRKRPEYGALEAMNRHTHADFTAQLKDFSHQIERIDRHPFPWTGQAVSEILSCGAAPWQRLLEQTREGVELAIWLDDHPLSSQDLPDLDDARDLLTHLTDGGGWGWGPFSPKVVKQTRYIRKLRIGEQPCETADALRSLVCWLNSEGKLRQLRERWKPHHEFTAAGFDDLAAELRDTLTQLEATFDALNMSQKLRAVLPGVDWADREAPHQVLKTLSAVKSVVRHEDARKALDRIHDTIVHQWEAAQASAPALSLAPSAGDLRQAVERPDTGMYAQALQAATAHSHTESLRRRMDELLARLRAAAPELAGALVVEAQNSPDWKKRASDFEQAWNWTRAHQWVTRMASPYAERQHRLELDRATEAIASTLGRLAAERAWDYCFKRMTNNEQQHLVAWQKAVKRIGKGTGKYAAKHRAEAQEHLKHASTAIPALVSPLYKVAETTRPGSEPIFDIAIIDEASQSGPDALLLAWLAKKIVIVGDDQQIQPSYTGINFEAVDKLRTQHLTGIPFAENIGAQRSSFFDLADIRFRGRIQLREHFRCMPEIIEFSNRLSYRNVPLIPLRQFGTERLQPPVVSHYIPDGYQVGTRPTVNKPEAEAVASAIAHVCADPAYAGKTIGMISLLGEAQAQMIQTLLLLEIGAEEMRRRKIICGDAYAFQGNERDVMFLSLVSAPGPDNPIVRALTDQAAQQRFNVAASRARDQMFLFHSVTLSQLSERPDDVRRQLLEYCLNPGVAQTDGAGLDVPHLEHIAHRARRERGTQPQPFESWFELDVFLRIVRRRYCVLPQFEAGQYRIDLVVEGTQSKLAIECDGDAWHGTDRYEEDTARQRDLERCGWRFWRIRESAFRLDPDEALLDLWETLERQGIAPTA